MARPTAAAGLVGAVLLMLLAFVTGQGTGISNPLASLFPGGSIPPPVRIYCRQNTALNMAVRDNRVVLATYNPNDIRQLWYPVYTHNSFFADNDGSKPFLLVNAATYQAMVRSNDGSLPVQLTYNYDTIGYTQLWAPATPGADGFYQVKVYVDQSKVLNGLGGNVRDGTVIGTYRATSVGANSFWSITSTSPFRFP